MSDSGKPIPASGFEKPSDHLHKSLTFSTTDTNNNKPDFRELDLGSPVSPLRTTGPAATTSTSTSSSSTSSGSLSGPLSGPHSGPHSGSHSGSLPGRTGSGRGSRLRSDSGELSPSFSGDGGCRKSTSGNFSNYGTSKNTTPTSSATSPAGKALPTGNICRTGKILKTGMVPNRSPKPDVLSLGTGNYGHGSIIRGGGEKVGPASPVSANAKRLVMEPDELKKLGNEQYKKGNYKEALGYYDRAILLLPGNASLRCNRSAALMCLDRLIDAVKECEEAVKLDSGYVRAHHRLGSFYISLGQVENARKHLCHPGSHPDPNELKKLQTVERHLNRCADLRRVRDWNGVLRESEAALASGADACSPLFACKSEALLKLRKVDEANLNLSSAPKFEAASIASCSQTKFFGMISEAYLLFVRAQIDMALGRFEDAASSIEKSGKIDPRNVEVAVLLQNVKSVSRARARGNDLFKSERLTEACSAYSEGLMLDQLNPVLFCNRAACWFKLGQFEKSLDDCNQALVIHPNYTKALLRRAATFCKLDRWDESVKDYEILRRELPNNNDIAEALFHAQVALKKSRGEDVNNLKFGGEVELITNLDQFKASVASSGASVVLYKMSSDIQCKQIIQFFDTLCSRYPSVNFLKVDLEESPEIKDAENVRVVPTIKIYKKGNRVKEMVCPSPEVLESSLRHYSL